MVESVVSSRFGKRPLLEIPALQFSNEDSSLLPHVRNHSFPSVQNPMQEPAALNHHPTFYPPGAWPQHGMTFAGSNRRINSAPPGSFYNPQGRQQHWGPSNDVMYPSPFSNSQSIFPELGNSFPAYAHIPQQVPARMPHPSYGLANTGFNITCELEYGRVMNIDMRDSPGEFLGIPQFLRTELMRTYGAYPYTKVKVKMEAGEFHIYASHGHRGRPSRPRQRGRESYTQGGRRFVDDDDDEYDRLTEWGSEVDSDSRNISHRNHRFRPRGIINERRRHQFE